MNTERRTPQRKGISIRRKLEFYLILFTVIVILVTWVFQVYLLDTFYEMTKKRELTRTANALETSLGDPNLELIAKEYASDCSMNVQTYRISSDGYGEMLFNIDATGGIAPVFSRERVAFFLKSANENNGTYVAKITAYGGTEVKEQRFSFFYPSGTYTQISEELIRLACARTVNGADGYTYLILLFTNLAPLDSTVQTLRVQFIWITVILLSLAALTAFFIYRRISRPLVSMTKAANRLALGKYDAVFSGKGYRETRELADTLNYASMELSKVDRLQKELIANISHDLRTPLTMIRGYVEIMRDVPGENTPENMQIIIDETNRLTSLVNDLLDLSGIQSGTRKIQPEVFDLTAAIREIMIRYEAFTKYRGYLIHVNTEPDGYVSADRGMILQVLYNLINNAINYSGERKTVSVTQTNRGNVTRISVSDSGEGIPEDKLPLIWDRYYKVDKVHRQATIGTGLGLSIVKEILEQHHAKYGVYSTVGVGSTFWFELPLIGRSAEESATEDRI